MIVSKICYTRTQFCKSDLVGRRRSTARLRLLIAQLGGRQGSWIVIGGIAVLGTLEIAARLLDTTKPLRRQKMTEPTA